MKALRKLYKELCHPKADSFDTKFEKYPNEFNENLEIEDNFTFEEFNFNTYTDIESYDNYLFELTDEFRLELEKDVNCKEKLSSLKENAIKFKNIKSDYKIFSNSFWTHSKLKIYDMMGRLTENCYFENLILTEFIKIQQKHCLIILQIIEDKIKDCSSAITLEEGSKSYPFISFERISELKSIVPSKFNLTKLISLCEELNFAFDNAKWYSTAILVRAIIDHIPPIFEKNTFGEVVANYNFKNKSTKEIIENLDKFARKIADKYLHTHIRNKESFPNQVQVNCSQSLDILLEEICIILKSSE